MRKKILFIHQNLVVGGAEELRLTILKYFDHSKFEITLCNIEGKGQIGKEIEQLGFSVICLNRKCRFWDLRITIDLYRQIKKGRFDIVQTSLFYANLHGRLAAYIAKVPCIISEEHNIYKWKESHPVFILIDRILSRITHRIITCSESVRRFTFKQERIPSEKFLTIHNCVDIKKFSIVQTKEQLRKDYGFNQTDKLIITVGSLCAQKGHKYLLQAFAKVREGVPGSKLLVVGSGPEEQKLCCLSARLQIKDSVIFMGARRDIPQLLKLSDIFVLPSLWEGFGIVLLEAMVSGLAVIATEVDGIPEIVIDGKTGLLVSLKDNEKLSENIIALLTNQKQCAALAAAGREHVLKNFAPEVYIDKLLSLYKEIS
jgi:glycosyltransferase involved in cell wall biosynthesis